jgi:flagellar basal-body rod protein FlgF
MYTSAAGAVVAEATIDNVANNLANVSTNGFKRTLMQIESQPQTDLYRYQTDPGQVGSNRLAGVPSQVQIGRLGSGSQIYATPTQFEQGQIAMNGNAFSFALSGPGFFAIQNRATGQVTYSRDGSFMRSADGLLTTLDGSNVLNAGGRPIPMPPVGKIEVDTKGAIDVDGAVSAQIGTFEFNNVNALQPLGGRQYLPGQGAGVRAATNTSVLQYSEEKSNADVVRSMVDLITAERWFQANEKSIQTQDEATNQAIATVGRTS